MSVVMIPFFARIRRQRIYAAAGRKRRRNQRMMSQEVLDRMAAEFGDEIPALRSAAGPLRHSVWRSMRYIASVLRQIPGPLELDPERWDTDPTIHAMCLGPRRMKSVFGSDRSLSEFFQSSTAAEAFALLKAEKKEKSISGVETSGEIVRRDVLQKAVYFENLQIVAPAAHLAESRSRLRNLLLTEFFAEAVRHVEALKRWKSELEHEHERIHVLQQVEPETDGRGTGTARKPTSNADAEQVHAALENRIAEISSRLYPGDHLLGNLTGLLDNPERYLSMKRLVFRLSRMGIELPPESTEPANEFPLAMVSQGDEEKRYWAAVWVRIRRDAFR